MIRLSNFCLYSVPCQSTYQPTEEKRLREIYSHQSSGGERKYSSSTSSPPYACFPSSSANGRRCRAMQCVSFLNHFIPKARLGQIAFGLFICKTVVRVLVSEIGLIFLRRRRQALTERDRVRHRPFFGGRRGDGVGGSDERHNHRDAQKWPNDTSRTCTK